MGWGEKLRIDNKTSILRILSVSFYIDFPPLSTFSTHSLNNSVTKAHCPHFTYKGNETVWAPKAMLLMDS